MQPKLLQITTKYHYHVMHTTKLSAMQVKCDLVLPEDHLQLTLDKLPTTCGELLHQALILDC